MDQNTQTLYKKFSQFVYTTYPNYLINYYGYSQSDIKVIHKELKSMMTYKFDNVYIEPLLLALLMEYDKKLGNFDSLSEYNQYAIANFSVYWNKITKHKVSNSSGTCMRKYPISCSSSDTFSYMNAINNINEGIKKFMVNRNGKFIDYIPAYLYMNKQNVTTKHHSYMFMFFAFVSFIMLAVYTIINYQNTLGIMELKNNVIELVKNYSATCFT